jgi:TonB family protein
MKFCPTCQTRYDEEILRFCTKDGTPLVDEQQPNFIQMPSESLDAPEDDFGEETVIRRNRPQNAPPAEVENLSAERIVIPTSETAREAVRAKEVQNKIAPRKSNTAAVVLFTILGTLAVLGLGFGGWYFLSQRDNAANINANTNVNANLANQNSNINADSLFNADFNINANTNVNANANVNANLKTPTPTKSPTPSPTKSPTPSPDANTNVNANTGGNTNVGISPTPTATPTPRPSPSPTAPANVNVGVLNTRAVSLPKPAYPPAARQMNASGQVTVQVTIDEDGNVTSARAVSGHPLLRNPAETAARQSKFNPVRVNGQPVRATGVVLYNFINQ